MEEIKQFYADMISFHWFNRFVNWLVISGGVIAQSAFMLATLYVTACVVAHQLLTWIFWRCPQVIPVLNQVSVLIFSWIPELIVAAAMTTSIQHWKTGFRTKYKWAFVWAVAYTIPTLVFLLMTIITILSFVSLQEISANSYQVTGANLIMRVLFGWFYGVVGMLFDSVGKAGYAEMIDGLRKNNQTLYTEKNEQIRQLMLQIEAQRGELQQQKQLLIESQKQQTLLLTESKRGTDNALEAYGEDCIKWLYSGSKTVTIDDINHNTGHSKQKIAKAKLRRSSRNPDLILMEGVIEWLKVTPPPAGKTETEPPALHLVNE